MMKSGFKRRLAAFLAVLMTFNSVPLTTLGDMDTRFLGEAEAAAEETYLEAADALYVEADDQDSEIYEVGGDSSEDTGVSEESVNAEPAENNDQGTDETPEDVEAEGSEENTEETSEETSEEPTGEVVGEDSAELSDDTDETEGEDSDENLEYYENADENLEDINIDSIVTDVEEVSEQKDVIAGDSKKPAVMSAKKSSSSVKLLMAGEDKTIAEKVEEYAEKIYSDPTSEDYVPQTWLIVEKGPYNDKLAGETGDGLSKYTIVYGYNTAETWAEGWDGEQTLYDEYKELSISVTLPDGLLLAGVSEGFEKYEVTGNEDGSHTYTWTEGLQWRLTSGQYSFDIDVYICGNGTENAINEFNMSDNVSFDTAFDVLNKEQAPGEEGYPVIGTYKQTVKASLAKISTKSDDEWAVMKTEAGVNMDRANHKAVVTYEVEVGFPIYSGDEVTGIDADSNNYAVPGRDGMKYMKLEDTLSSIIRNGKFNGQPASLKSATIRKNNSSESVSFDIGAEKNQFNLKSEDGSSDSKLALNTVKVDADGLTAEKEQPVESYTKYIVTAEYELTEEMVEHFENPQAEIDFSNTAAIEYQLAKKEKGTSVDDAEQTGKMPVMAPASLVVNKNLKKISGQTSEYKNEYGEIYYHITAPKAFKLYVKDGDTYTQKTGTSESTEQIISAKETVYLTPGIAYTVTEAMTEYQDNEMDLVSVNGDTTATSALKTPVEGEDWSVTFLNKETKGDIKITKKNDGYPQHTMQNVEFTLTKKNDSDFAAIKKKTNASGVVSFESLSYGTYILTETVPTGYSTTEGKQSFEITISAEHPLYEETLINHKKYADISLTKYVGNVGGYNKAGNGFPTDNVNKIFVLQRSTDGTNWSDVTEDIYGHSISTNLNSGMIQASVDAFTTGGTVYQYRLKKQSRMDIMILPIRKIQ